MKYLLTAVALILALLAAGVVWIGGPMGPSLEEVAHLQTPQILQMDSQRVLVVVASGNPNAVGPKAFGLLMKTYFSLDGVPKWGAGFQPPRARWPSDPNTPPEEWVGHYAMPIPDGVTEAPSTETENGLSVELETWDYGEVAQILHVGRYDQEDENIARLKAFIEDQGYEISGLHEEEYLKGPGFLFAGNPDKYLTLIRYPVRRVEGS
jgi:effector-binding domain-containing protein